MTVLMNYDLSQVNKRKLIIQGFIDCLAWSRINYVLFGAFLAGIWTLIPTHLLSWGAKTTNYIGYVSHCSFSPVSSILLIALSLIHLRKLDRSKFASMAYTISFGFTALGFLIGVIEGVTIKSFFVAGFFTILGAILAFILDLRS
ncbi:MAG: hypothetical protein INQ03_02680 [Candidatus Heimdallarchaeota archaeon]|nr:hypothetical protein [Candidatus Heimdallarchaeota archaeon]